MRSASIIVATMLLACGGPNPEFAGTWTGPATLSFVGGASLSYPGVIGAQFQGNKLVFSRLCPDNTGSLVVEGSGDSVKWAGKLVCNPAAFAGCTRMLTYEFGVIKLNADRTLVATAEGTSMGCGDKDFSMTFNGTK